jgi:Ca2+-binding RTX toxin-like protein
MGDDLPAIDLGTDRTALAVDAGQHGCAVLDNATVKCWGDNLAGGLGQGDNEHRGDEPGEMGDDLPAVDLPPPNDDFVDSTVLFGDFGSVRGSNGTASNESGEPLHDSRAQSDATTWWSWTAPSSGAVEFNTDGSTFDTILAVYTGPAVDDLAFVTSNDDTNVSVQSEVRFPTTLGTTYRIAVASFGPTATGRIRLNWLPNDDFADAVTISGAAGGINGSTVSATLETGEPDHNPHISAATAASVWYRWTAPRGGRVLINTSGSSFDTVLAVYTGAAVDGLTLVGSNDDAGGFTSAVTFTATAGSTYRIAVGGYDGSEPNSGFVQLNWRQSAPCDGRSVTRDLSMGDPATGTAGADVIRGTGGNDTINGGGGVDRICGGGGTDRLAGGAGNLADRLFGEAGNDTLRGGAGNDALVGGAGNDALVGEAGNDALNGGPNRDTCNGGPQRDTQVACEVRAAIP